MRTLIALLVLAVMGTSSALAYTPPDNPVACIQRILIAHGASLAESGKLDAKTKSAAQKYARDKGWGLPALDENGTDTWCDYFTAEAIGVPWLTALPHPGEPYLDLTAARQRSATTACIVPLLVDGPKQNPLEPQTEVFLDKLGVPEWGADLTQALVVYQLALLEKAPPGPAASTIDKYAAALKTSMLTWARTNAPTRVPNKDRDNYVWGLTVLFPHVLQSRNLLVDASMLTAEEQSTIDGWLSSLAAQMHLGHELALGTELLDPTSRYRSHNGRRSLDALLWAIQSNDVQLFNWAVRTGYVRFLRNIYPDGHLPDAYRSSWAEWYGSLTIDQALFTAVAAEHQNVDLFHVRVAGRGVQDAVGFWASAYENEALVNVYAKEAKFISLPFPGEQDKSLRYQPRRTPLLPGGWLDLYLDTFPNDPAVAPLLRIRADLAAHTHEKAFFSNSFGDVSCFWGPEKGKPFPPVPN